MINVTSSNTQKSYSVEYPLYVGTHRSVILSNTQSLDETLLRDLIKLKTLTSQYAIDYISPIFRKQLFKQLDWLLDPNGWEEDDDFAKPESFITLIKFIINAHPYQAPYLGLSNNGNILASWIHKENKLILECFPNEHVKWFVSCTFENKPDRASGESFSLKRLLGVLEPYKKAGWFTCQ